MEVAALPELGADESIFRPGVRGKPVNRGDAELLSSSLGTQSSNALGGLSVSPLIVAMLTKFEYAEEMLLRKIVAMSGAQID